jgi:phosphoadenosine phosphosulfate reductase
MGISLSPPWLDEGVDLKTVALEAARDLEGKTPQEILRWAADTFGDRFCLSSSMGDGVMPSLAASVRPGIDVIFLDTGYHFPETIGTRDAVDFVYDVNVRTMLPLLTVAEQDATEGKDLWSTNPDRCCALRKVEPLGRALEGYDAYASGVRRDESPSRADTPVVQWDEKRQLVKVNPIAAWTQADVDAYIEENDILVNPLAEDGYPSIGCRPCTFRVAPGEDPRSGRWKGAQKSECGLHV